MRELTQLIATASARCEADDVKVLVVSGAGLTKIDVLLRLPKVLLLDASHNCLTDIRGLFQAFPSLWWARVGHNWVSSLDFETMPLALGSLDVSVASPYDEKMLSKIKYVNILRLTLSTEPTYKHSDLVSTVRLLPLIWVLNDDYLPLRLLKAAAMAAPAGEDTPLGGGGTWNGTSRFHDRESSLLCAARDIPYSGDRADWVRLEVILEDYLDEACYFNRLYCNANKRLQGRRKPWVDCNKLLYLSHAVRIDLSVILTLSITIDLPIPIFVDGLEARFGPYYSRDQLSDILSLPLFAKTAVVSMIRRICRKEIDEYAILRTILNKSLMPAFRAAGPVDFETAPSFQGRPGFRHLACVKSYCDTFDPLADTSSLSHPALKQLSSPEGPYSELEAELLAVLPDLPTRASSTRDAEDKAASMGAYSSWVSLAARHAVVLLSRSKKCPSLTKAQTSKAMQDIYGKLLPVLKIAKMTYADMDIGGSGSGPRLDGRPEYAHAAADTAVLQYGQGLPRGSALLLSWVKMPPTSTINCNATTNPSSNPSSAGAAAAPEGQAEGDPAGDASSVLGGGMDIDRCMTDDLSSMDDSKVLSLMTRSVASRGRGGLGRGGAAAAQQQGGRAGPASSPQRSPPRRETLNLSSKQISGFSADVAWDSSFLLAPSAAIRQHNQTLQETDGWRPLDCPPLAVQSPGRRAMQARAASASAFLTEVSAPAPAREAGAGAAGEGEAGPQGGSGEEDEFRISVHSGEGGRFSFHDHDESLRASMTQLSAVLEGEGEGSTTQGGEARLSPSLSPVPLEHAPGQESILTGGQSVDESFVRRVEADLQRDLGLGALHEGDGEAGNQTPRGRHRPSYELAPPASNNSREREGPSRPPSFAAPASQLARMQRLMKEMGTCRNVASISDYNARRGSDAHEQQRRQEVKFVKNNALLNHPVPASYLPNSSQSTYGTTQTSAEYSVDNGSYAPSPYLPSPLPGAGGKKGSRHVAALVTSKSLDSSAWMRQSVNDGEQCKIYYI
jgi:hypothetical protein